MSKKKVLLFLPFLLIFISCITSPAAGGRMPSWVNSVESVYPGTRYAAASGFGSSRAAAEENALAALTAFFGQSIQVERTAASSYKQAIVNGVMEGWVDNAEMRTNIRTTSVIDNLLGAEIKDVWFDSKDTYYAVAVMEKARAVQIYNELIKTNLNIINNLTAMTPSQKISLDGVIRYWFASAVADVNESCRNMVLLLDGQVSDTITGGEYYRLETQSIIRAIPITINVSNDRNGRIFGAFARRLGDWGFETAAGTQRVSANQRFVLDANVSLSPVELADSPNVFSRIELSANLRDTSLNHVLISHNFNSREGHISRVEAENRCFAAAERNINEVFAVLLSDYLSQLKPRN
ncbi:MAG: LPP20 family lipoprotein [Treponema sp.]|nr:LPP20 family lipoprotein [Treponema sp.]